jgi:hypothetical protein
MGRADVALNIKKWQQQVTGVDLSQTKEIANMQRDAKRYFTDISERRGMGNLKGREAELIGYLEDETLMFSLHSQVGAAEGLETYQAGIRSLRGGGKLSKEARAEAEMGQQRWKAAGKGIIGTEAFQTESWKYMSGKQFGGAEQGKGIQARTYESMKEAATRGQTFAQWKAAQAGNTEIAMLYGRGVVGQTEPGQIGEGGVAGGVTQYQRKVKLGALGEALPEAEVTAALKGGYEQVTDQFRLRTLISAKKTAGELNANTPEAAADRELLAKNGITVEQYTDPKWSEHANAFLALTAGFSFEDLKQGDILRNSAGLLALGKELRDTFGEEGRRLGKSFQENQGAIDKIQQGKGDTAAKKALKGIQAYQKTAAGAGELNPADIEVMAGLSSEQPGVTLTVGTDEKGDPITMKLTDIYEAAGQAQGIEKAGLEKMIADSPQLGAGYARFRYMKELTKGGGATRLKDIGWTEEQFAEKGLTSAGSMRTLDIMKRIAGKDTGGVTQEQELSKWLSPEEMAKWKAEGKKGRSADALEGAEKVAAQRAAATGQFGEALQAGGRSGNVNMQEQKTVELLNGMLDVTKKQNATLEAIVGKLPK